MANKINIKFAAQGHPGVIAAVKALNKQTEKLAATNRLLTGAAGPLTKSQQEVAKGFLAQQRAARNAGGTFSVLRSKMLLASFAAGLFSQSLLKLANMAGDAEEQMNKASVVFGASTNSVLKFAQETSDATGRSRFSLIQMSASVQDILVPMGMMRHEAANLSKEIVKTAIDVASFNNVAESDAMRDFNSALVGNHETVRKYGIVISEARMQQVAMDQGIIKAGETLTDQQKILARLAILQMDTSDAMGDAERTASSYANVMKALGAEFEETGIALGQMLMPVVKVFAQALIPLLKAIGNTKVWLALAIAISNSALAFVKAKVAVLGYDKAIKLATTSTRAFLTVLGKFGIALIAIEAIGYVWNKIFPPDDEIKKGSKNLEDFNKELIDFESSLSNLTIGQLQNAIFLLKMELKPTGSFIARTKDEIDFLNEKLQIAEARLLELTGGTLDYSKAQQKVRDIISGLNTKLRDNSAAQRLANEAMDRYGININDKVLPAQQELIDELKDYLDLEGKLAGLNEIARLEKRIEKLQGVSAAQMFLNEQDRKGITISTEHADRIRELNDLFEEQKELKKLLSEEESIIQQVLEKSKQTELEEINTKILKLEKIAEEIGLTNELAEALDNLYNKKEEIEDLDGKTHKLSMFRNEAEKSSTVLLLESMGALAAQHKQGQKASARLSQLAAIINTYEGVTFALSKQDYMGAAIVLTQGLAAVAQIENAMGQMGAGGGSGSKPSGVFGSFEQGGYVGGRRHSEGGTLIEAERGEFVMSRRAVESIGLETLNQLNSGTSGAGSVVVNVSGNVMTQDFVEGELAESIKEAVRRGSDFGIG